MVQRDRKGLMVLLGRSVQLDRRGQRATQGKPDRLGRKDRRERTDRKGRKDRRDSVDLWDKWEPRDLTDRRAYKAKRESHSSKS